MQGLWDRMRESWVGAPTRAIRVDHKQEAVSHAAGPGSLQSYDRPSQQGCLMRRETHPETETEMKKKTKKRLSRYQCNTGATATSQLFKQQSETRYWKYLPETFMYGV